MTVDEALLARSRRFEDAAVGFSEEFLQPAFGTGRTVAVISRPLAAQRSTGFVICHSFASEQMHLYRLDVAVARRLAAAGFPVLRFHSQGYGDHSSSEDVGGLGSHLRDAVDAVDLLRDVADVEWIGAAGARFGGMVAALVADRLRLPALAVWQPAVRGSKLARDLLRSQALQEILTAGDGDGRESVLAQLKDALDAIGWVDVRGFRLSGTAYREVAGFDLTVDLKSLAADVLLVSVAETAHPTRSVSELAAHLSAIGASCRIETIRDVLAAQFGEYHYTNEDDLSMKEDRHFDLFNSIAERTVAWALQRETATPS